MDYGQSKKPIKSGSQPTFFTAGAGAPRVNTDNSQRYDNIDLNNEKAGWGIVQSPSERDRHNIGNTAVSASEAPELLDGSSLGRESTNSLETDQMINLEMPPDVENSDPTTINNPEKKKDETTVFDKDKIKTKEFLDPVGIEVVKNTIDNFNKGKINPDEFYEVVRNEEDGLVMTNLANSYGNESAWEKKTA